MPNEINVQLAGKVIAVLGYGAEGKSTIRFLLKHAVGNKILVADQKDTLHEMLMRDGISGVTVIGGEDYLQRLALEKPDLVFKSPGVPMKTVDHLFTSQQLTSQTHMFLSLLRERIIGITGTKGKTTTAYLLKTALCAGGVDACLVGNMGSPVLDILDDDRPNRFYVFEMSSHMLENLCVSPRFALLLNIYEEHLDHYRSFADYWQAKLNVVLHQQTGDVTMLGKQALEFLKDSGDKQQLHLPSAITQNSEMVGVWWKKPSGNEGAAGLAIQPFDMPRLHILGEHNRHNARLAYTMAKCIFDALGVQVQSDAMILNEIAAFPGIPHRLEYVGYKKNIHWYNDSISTIPQAAICAVAAIPQVKTLILGGMDRGIDYGELVRFICSGAVEHVVLMPDTGHKLLVLLSPERLLPDRVPEHVHLHEVADLEEAVKCAMLHTPLDCACVLSPAAASYGFYRNFEERGNAFKTFVNALETGF